MKIRKAVIVAAGLGTRMLPASKVVPKEILPVVDRPAIQVIVEEAVASGISEIVLVLSPGRFIAREHFEPALDLERQLESRGKNDLLTMIRKTNAPARITTAIQNEPLGLGHAVLQARAAIGDEPFGVFYPDDIVDSEVPLLRQIINATDRVDGPVVSLMRVQRSDLSKYGIVEATGVGERLYHLTNMIEKPPPEKAPSDFAIIGRHVLTPDIFEEIAKLKPGAGGELQLTDALLGLARRRKLYGYEFEGTRYDLGDRLGFIQAQVGFGLKRPELANDLRAYLRTLAIK